MKLNINKLRNSKVVKHSLGYTALNFIEKLLPFLILPILTRVLSKEEVGLFVLYQTLVEVLMPIVTLSIDNSILINYYKLTSKEFSKYFSNSFLLVLILFFLVWFVIFCFSKPLGNIIGFPPNWLIIICFLILFRYFTNLRQSLWRIEYKIKSYGLFTISLSIIGNVSGLILVLLFNYGWEGILIGHLFSYSIFGIYSIKTFIKSQILKVTESFVYVKSILTISFPIALHRLGIWLGSAANKIIISSIIGVIATGSYGVGVTLATIITVLEDAISKAIVPHIYEKLKDPNSENNRNIVKMSYGIYAILIIVSLTVYLGGYFGVELIFGQDYSDVKLFLFPLILAAMFKGFYKLHVNYIFFTSRTIEVTKITFMTGLLNIFLSYILVVNFGIIGACYSLLVINFIQYILSFYIGNKLIPMPWLKF
ncbi:oligosaccharide flippase family protein [Belliella sp. R4-6]|uniref:Oligosaccharide flippase family protein n=1 Tax=Belliella alkalica TaxID=1730871 RepID=A0ABS9VE11_9BACT|nr:oligosaccharide flippase family protein [Belliella alkalica]MCH7414628.1 oligosaccharide flippase family protein [Belliella alkalica]